MNKSIALKILFPTGIDDKDWIVVDRDGVQTIENFNTSLGAFPSDDQLNLAYQDYQKNAYKYARANEYPDFREYLDGIVKNDQNQIQKYINDCLAVKAKYPKE
jgi:hypothetical protein